MFEYIILGILFLTVLAFATLVLSAVIGLFIDPPPAPEEEGEEAPPRRPLFGPLNGALAAMVPMSADGETATKKALLRAGFYHRSALTDYQAVRSLLVVMPLLLALLLALLWDDATLSVWTVGYGVLAAVLGLLLPRVYLISRGNARARQIQHGLPLAMDLFALCLKAGVNLSAAFGHVARQMRPTHPILAHELELTYKQAQIGSLGHALRRLAERVQVPEVSTFAYTLAQSEELGTDTAAALHELSTNQRTNLRQAAEAQANRTSFWMLFPTIGCLYLAAAIFLISPGFLQIVREGQSIQDVTGQTRSVVEEANRSATTVDRLLRRPAPPQPQPSPVPRP
jgi:tight adherence protein C